MKTKIVLLGLLAIVCLTGCTRYDVGYHVEFTCEQEKDMKWHNVIPDSIQSDIIDWAYLIGPHVLVTDSMVERFRNYGILNINDTLVPRLSHYYYALEGGKPMVIERHAEFLSYPTLFSSAKKKFTLTVFDPTRFSEGQLIIIESRCSSLETLTILLFVVLLFGLILYYLRKITSNSGYYNPSDLLILPMILAILIFVGWSNFPYYLSAILSFFFLFVMAWGIKIIHKKAKEKKKEKQ